MTLRNILLGATMLCAATTPAIAFAQDTAEAPASDTDYGNDIIVTATKRSQTLQDTPIAVSVTSAADIQNAQIRDLIDLQSAVPSLRVVTQKPQYEFGGSVEASYGNYDAFVIKGDITGPISDKIAFSLGGNYNRRDGYARDVNLDTDVNDRNRWGVRGQLLLEPTEALTIRLIGDYDKIDENCCIAGNVIAGPTVAITNALAGGPSVDANNPFSYRVYNNFLSSNLIKNYGGSGQIDYDLGNMSLTSITAYREVRSNTNQDSDFTSADLIGQKSDDTAINTFTQELRLASDFDGPINFLIGGYYFNEKIKQHSQIYFGDDFRDGKVTLPVILAYARGSAEEREFWKQAIVGHRASDDDLAYATSLLLKHDTIADTLARARHYGQRAVDAIGGFRSSQAKAALTEAVAFAVARAY